MFYIEDEEEEWLTPQYIKKEGESGEAGAGDVGAKNDVVLGDLESYEIYEILGDCYSSKGDASKACEYYSLGGEAAMTAGKMKKATILNMKAEG